MSKEVMGIINLVENDQKISALTLHRPIAAIPFGGRYRVIDFAISNMVNCGIQNVAIFTRDKYRSLQDHLGSGKYWNLDRKRGGLTMHHPMLDFTDVQKRQGDLENFKDNLDFLKNSKYKQLLIIRSYAVTNIDYSPYIDQHINSDADVTIIGKSIGEGVEGSQYIGLDTLQIDNKGKVMGVGLNFGSLAAYRLSLEMYLIKKEVLIDLIINAYQNDSRGFLKQVLLDRLPQLDVRFAEYDGDAHFINSINNYYKANMALLNRMSFNNLFEGSGSIYTKIKDEPSTMYTKTSKVKNSIVANGCIIEGEVENCVLFRGVTIQKGAMVRNSIIMQNTVIGENSRVNYVIADKGVEIVNNKLLMGDGGVPYVLSKGSKIT